VLFDSPPVPSAASLRFLEKDDDEGGLVVKTWLPESLNGGWLFPMLGPIEAAHRPVTWEGVELTIPRVGTALGRLDRPIRLVVGVRIRMLALVRPGADRWVQPCRWKVPPRLQDRGFWRPRLYVLERTMAWGWIERSRRRKDV
jgi:hypothetical protein